MQDLIILIITANTALSAAAARAFAPARIRLAVLAACQQFPAQTEPEFILVLLDMDSLGPDKLKELKTFLARTRGLPVIAMFDAARTANREIVEILSAGADDAMPNAAEMPLLVAKTKSHLRRLAAYSIAPDRDRDLNRGSGI